MLAETMADTRAGRIDPKLGSTLGYLGMSLLRAFEVADLEQRLERLEQKDDLENQVEQAGENKATDSPEAECICFPPNEPLHVELRVEMEAVAAVTCPIHGKRFKNFAGSVYRSIYVPTHLDPHWRAWHSPRYLKAMDASFPPDRWPATKIVEPDGAVRFVVKDGTEIHRLDPPEEILEYKPLTDWERLS